ncbi:MAG: bicarbonate-binding protein, partial [Deltaproteobacteria bacterium]
MTRTARAVCWSTAAALVAAAAPVSRAASPTERLTMAVPGIPPVFSGLFAFVAKEQGLFEKYGVDV